MSGEIILVLAILAVVVVLLVFEWMPLEVLALLVFLAPRTWIGRRRGMELPQSGE